MLTYQDCVGMSDLTEEEIDAIAEHEHIPRIVAIEVGHCLVHDEPGIPCIHRIILEDIAMAERRGDTEHVLVLKHALAHFVRAHPGTAASAP